MGRAHRIVALAFAALLAACTEATPPAGPSAPAQQAQAMPRLWVLSVGVSAYGNKDFSLKFADRDARAVHDFFGTKRGGNVPEGRRYLLTNAEATRARILTTLQEIAGRSADEDMIVVFLAMHAMGGATDPFYFMAHDTNPHELLATGISDDDVKKAVSRASAKRFAMLLDTCHAGSFGFDKLLGNKRAVRGETKKVIDSLVTLGQQGTAVLAAADQAEYSEEDPRWGGGHGVFTYHLLRGLSGDADREPRDGIVTMRELFDYIYGPVKGDTEGRQHPSFAGNGKLPLALSEPRSAGVPDSLADNARPAPDRAIPVTPLRSDAPQPTPVTPLRPDAGKPAVVKPIGDIKLLQQVHFMVDSAAIPAESSSILTEVANTLRQHPGVSVEIQGHTDGRESGNNKLGEDRAQAVAEWLVKSGVDAKRLTVRGFGRDRPLAPNVTEQNRALNRRVQFAVIQTDSPRGAAPAPPRPDARVAPQVSLPPQDQLTQCEAFISRMQGVREAVRHDLEQARTQSDVVKVLCLNDKLAQVDVAIRSARERRDALADAVRHNDTDLASHEFTISSVLRQRVEQLVTEAAQCVGRESAAVEGSKVQPGPRGCACRAGEAEGMSMEQGSWGFVALLGLSALRRRRRASSR